MHFSDKLTTLIQRNFVIMKTSSSPTHPFPKESNTSSKDCPPTGLGFVILAYSFLGCRERGAQPLWVSGHFHLGAALRRRNAGKA